MKSQWTAAVPARLAGGVSPPRVARLVTHRMCGLMPPTHRRAAALQKLVHFMTAFAVVMKAIAKLEHPEGSWPLIFFFLTAGIYIVVITLLHGHLHAHEHLLTRSVYALESAVTAIVAILYVQEGRAALQYVFALASVLFAVALVVHIVRVRGGNASDAAGVRGA